MSRFPTIFSLTVTLALTSAALGSAQQQPPAGTTGSPTRTQSGSPKVVRVTNGAGQDQGISRGSQLVGLRVFDPSGAAVGEIKDLAVDSSGRVIVVLSRPSGGFTGVPLSSLTPQLQTFPAGATPRPEAPRPDTSMGVGGVGGTQTASVDRFVFSGDVNRLRSAPALPDLSRIDEAWTRATAQHFGVATAAGAAQPGPAAAGRVATATGQQVRPVLGFQSLMSRRLTTSSGDRIGEFRDIAIDLRTGQAPFVIFGRPGTGTGASGTSGEILHGASFDDFAFNDPSTALMDIDPGTLDRTPGLDIAKLPSEPSLRLVGSAPRATTPAAGTIRPGTSGESMGGKKPSSGQGSTPKPSGGTPPR